MSADGQQAAVRILPKGQGEAVKFLQPAFFGFDRINVPKTIRAPEARWMALMLAKSTFRVAGAYLQEFEEELKNNAPREWNRLLRAHVDNGWGIGAIYLGHSRVEFKKKKVKVTPPGKKEVTIRTFGPGDREKWLADMNEGNGRRHAGIARQWALDAGLRRGSIIWLDIEDSSDTILEPHEMNYYLGFFDQIEKPEQDAAFRAGVYTNAKIAAQLLATHPDLHVWEVLYTNDRVDMTSLPDMRRATKADPRFGLDPTNKNAQIFSFQVVPESGVPWIAWPAWHQFEGNNQAVLPPKTVGNLTPLNNWDFNSLLVRDPSCPVAAPRVAGFIANGMPYVARINDVDATFDDQGVRQSPRHGQLRLFPLPQARQAVTIDPAKLVLDPSSAIVAVTNQAQPEIFLALDTGRCAVTRLSGNRWTPLAPLPFKSDAYELRFPHAFAAKHIGGETHFMFVGKDYRIRTARRIGGNGWEGPDAWSDKLLVHPFARLSATVRSRSVHAFTFDQKNRLVTFHSSVDDKPWPRTDHSIIGEDALFPTGALCCVTITLTEILLVGLGRDLRPWRYLLSAKPQGMLPSPGEPIGSPGNVLMPHTQMSLTRIDDDHVVLIACGPDGEPIRYVLARSKGWKADARAPLMSQPIAPRGGQAFVPNPFSTYETLSAGGRLGLLALVSATTPGAVGAFAVQVDSGRGTLLPE